MKVVITASQDWAFCCFQDLSKGKKRYSVRVGAVVINLFHLHIYSYYDSSRYGCTGKWHLLLHKSPCRMRQTTVLD